MSASEEPASQDIGVESGDSSTSLHAHTPKSQQEQQRELLNVKALDWITEDEWDMHIQENSDRLRSRSDVSIFRVPNVLLRASTKREAYVPTRVSLGPYHHRSAELPPMNSHKGRAVRRMMTRFNNNLPKDLNIIDFSVFARREILKVEEKIRNSYEEIIDCDGKTLALILCLDGCFILEILRSCKRDHYEPIFDSIKIGHTGRDILTDILKLENQIPLIVLRKLLELELKSTDIDQIKNHFKPYMKYFLSYFNPFDLKYDKYIDQWFCLQRDGQEAHHILDLVHRFIVSSQSPNGEPADQIGLRKCTVQCPTWCVMCHQDTDEEGNEYISIPRAVELRNAGIKFEQCEGINSIKFDSNSATLFLPKITVQDATELLFRNLIAFEMCKPSAINPVAFNPVACYVALMDCLIDSIEDVALLRGMGIVTNYIGSDANVAELFNGLGKEVNVDMTDVFDQVTRKVNLHYKNKVKVQIAELVKEHFSSPWRALALAAAIVILLLTALQTVFSGLSLP